MGINLVGKPVVRVVVTISMIAHCYPLGMHIAEVFHIRIFIRIRINRNLRHMHYFSLFQASMECRINQNMYIIYKFRGDFASLSPSVTFFRVSLEMVVRRLL